MNLLLIAVAVVLTVSLLILRLRARRVRRPRPRARALEVDEELFRRQLLDQERNEFIASPPHEISRERAAERRRRMQAEMENFQIPFPPRIAERAMALPVEFLETPPMLRTEPRRFFEETRVEAFGQMARLQWQVGSDEFLLGERVVDALVVLMRQGAIPKHNPLVRLAAPDPALAAVGRFPAKVIIETDRPNLVADSLRELVDWFGIGIDFAPARRVQLYNRCTVGSGMFGMVGGLVTAHDATYGMTCAHVLSSDCQSVRYRGNPEVDGNQPDAALIHVGTPCFRSYPAVHCTCATDSIVQRCTQRKIPVLKRHPGLPLKRGVVRGHVFGFDVGGIYYRFPHLEIVPLLAPAPFMYLPLIDRAFSKAGDSGSWVFESEGNHWLGMVVGGDDFFLASFVAEAQQLLDYFTLCISVDSKLASVRTSPMSYT